MIFSSWSGFSHDLLRRLVKIFPQSGITAGKPAEAEIGMARHLDAVLPDTIQGHPLGGTAGRLRPPFHPLPHDAANPRSVLAGCGQLGNDMKR